MRVLILMLVLSANIVCAADTLDSELAVLNDRAVSIKRDMLDLGKDMYIFEREKLLPDDLRVSVFLTVDVGEFFRLDNIKLLIDKEPVVTRGYHHHETDGLEKGASNRLFAGNFMPGRHQLLVFVEGVGPRERAYKQALRHSFTKRDGEPVFLEIRLRDKESRLQPELVVKQW